MTLGLKLTFLIPDNLAYKIKQTNKTTQKTKQIKNKQTNKQVYKPGGLKFIWGDFFCC